ncbi:MAG: phosphomevalonate kinase [Calditrichia bacterium]
MKVVCKAPGKLILLGEYAVLEGAPALVTAVDRYATVEIESSPDQTFRISSPNLNITALPFSLDEKGRIQFDLPDRSEEKQKLIFFQKAFELAWQKRFNNNSPKPLHFILDTRAFYLEKTGEKLGLGSSAALTVALLYALLKGINLPGGSQADLTAEEIFPAALTAHFAAQGKKGSGIDIAASLYGGFLQFQISSEAQSLPRVQPRQFPTDLYLIPIWSGKSASTSQLVSRTLKYKETNPAAYWKLMDKLIRLSREGCQAVQRQQTNKFLDICDHYHHTLKQFGENCNAAIISPEHQEIAERVRACGGVYKPSGAGGGDIGIALCDDTVVAQKISEEILHFGYKIIKLSPSQTGVHLENF